VDFEVRPYDRADRADVHRIGADTAFFGEPIEAFLDDRRLWCDAFCTYYTDLESEHSWVACAGQKVIGFLFGCVDTELQQRRWRREILAVVMWRALRGRYQLGRITWRYTAKMIQASLRGEFARVDLATYPAHLHINVEGHWRAQGAGRRMMEAYLDQLRQLGVPGVHLHTTSLNEAACRLYTRVGFRLLDAHLTRVWSHLVARPVENRCYGLELA
jgi:GNAT superfamily N-acetyltransferase